MTRQFATNFFGIFNKWLGFFFSSSYTPSVVFAILGTNL